ncbi:MAG: hypothetical protein OEN01_09490 [Candidatus Krumholzibacteria bacterium]|nr:hypothetical protein [Candidatus Krumholzibacteria bacterium]
MIMIVVGALMWPAIASAQWTYFENNSDIRALYQKGETLWIGTNGGVVLLDLLSDEFVGKITAADSLPGNSVRVIQGRGRDVYVGTDDGLSILTGGKVTVYARSRNYVFSDIRSISFGTSGETYLGTYGHGVVVMKPRSSRGKRLERITRQDSLLDNKVFAVSEIATGRVYFATSLGLCAYRDSAWVGFQAGAGLPRGEVKQLIEVGGDRFYLLIAGRGVYRFNHSRAVRIRPPDAFEGEDVGAIALGRNGALWVAGRFGGIARYRNGAWTVYGEDDHAVMQARWRCAYAAPGGTVFFGSADGLIVAVEDGKTRKISVPSTLPSGHVGRICEGADGRTYVINERDLLSSSGDADDFTPEMGVGRVLAVATSPDGVPWASTRQGILHKEGDGWTIITVDIEPRTPLFVSLAFDDAGHLWAGTSAGEVYRFDGEIWVRYADRHQLSSGPIFALLVDRSQTLWALSRSGGAHRYEGFKWQHYPIARFDSLHIQSGALDATGKPVVVTERAIWRFDNDKGWSQILARAPSEIGRYRSVCFDKAGRMYLGTTWGLALAADNANRFVGARDGLRGKDVAALSIDSKGYLWVGFRDEGIARISLENLW